MIFFICDIYKLYIDLNNRLLLRNYSFLRDRLFSRNTLETALLPLNNVSVNGSLVKRLFNTSNLLFKKIKSENLIAKIPSIAIAMGSACTSETMEPSHVLKAMGLCDEDVFSSVRFSIGKQTTEKEIGDTIVSFTKAIAELRS